MDALNVRAPPVSEDGFSAAHTHVLNIISHHFFTPPSQSMSNFLTVLTEGMLEMSFEIVAQELYDFGTDSQMLIDFRLQWRRLHQLPSAHGEPDYAAALDAPSFGAAAALFVDSVNVSDAHLDALLQVWRKTHGVVIHSSSAGISSTLEAMRRLGL
ncbi:hypothetical protein C8R43DRAFT_273311 [Mycena crocata]|nr:hypothetical protein C8R43DRAFT_273311 [Mycena crocata]